MITISTTIDHREQVESLIASISQLDELIDVCEYEKERNNYSNKLLSIEEDQITSELEWYDREPPYILPETPLNKDNFLAIVFYKLGNHQRAFEFVEQDSDLYNHFVIGSFMQIGREIDNEFIDFAKNNSPHNYAILLHYGLHKLKVDASFVISAYQHALETSENDELRLFTAKHYFNLLLDVGEYQQVINEAKKYIELALTPEAKNAMQEQISMALMATLEMPYDTERLEEIAQLQLNSISFYDERGLKIKSGLMLIDASEIANFREDYTTSKELISRAITYFREENVPEFLGEATIRKATLLYTWSKNGSPQYYKPAINAFQDTLKVFKRDTHPEKFAEVQHNLALIYSEIPVGVDEKAIWSAFCASAFKEALAVYNKENYPYQFATVAHNYATALMGFPEAKVHNNLTKAESLFEQALEIRTNEYPIERSLSLLNQLELYWLLHNENETEEHTKLLKMQGMAQEVKELSSDPQLHERADDMLVKLEELKSLIN